MMCSWSGDGIARGPPSIRLLAAAAVGGYLRLHLRRQRHLQGSDRSDSTRRPALCTFPRGEAWVELGSQGVGDRGGSGPVCSGMGRVRSGRLVGGLEMAPPPCLQVLTSEESNGEYVARSPPPLSLLVAHEGLLQYQRRKNLSHAVRNLQSAA